MTTRPTFESAREFADSIPDGITIAVTGSGGGLLEPDYVLEAIEDRFLRTGHPCDLTLVHGFGLGDRDRRGANRFAHQGMVRRVIASHWTWSNSMIELAAEGKIEAYSLPAGVMAHVLRESGARRPGLITRTGLGTFVDPRMGGARVNDRTTEDIVTLLQLDGQEYLHYLPIHVDVAVVRGSVADADGNISLRDEAAQLDILALALVAEGSGGTCVAQVKSISSTPLHNSEVKLPGVLIDTVIEAPHQWQTSMAEHLPTLAGEPPQRPELIGMPTEPARAIIARRAAREVASGSVLNVGFGISSSVIDALAEIDRLNDVVLAIEQGHYGGYPASGDLFGMAHGSRALLSAPDQFDVFSAGRLDMCCLGMGQLDRHGNVNVSRLAGRVIGPGGFIDISQNAASAVFCGTFTGRGLKVRTDDGNLHIEQEGSIRKIVPDVEEVTFSGARAAADGKPTIYITERAVFQLTPTGIELTEIAPGIDLQREVLDLLDFTPLISEKLRTMDRDLFGSTA